MTCKQCKNMGECKDDAFVHGAKFDPDESAKYCTGFEPITTADRIRAMSDEELADFFAQRDMIILRKALAVFEAEALLPENALTELRKDMLEALQKPAEEG